jgi:hypothetical protein
MGAIVMTFVAQAITMLIFGRHVGNAAKTTILENLSLKNSAICFIANTILFFGVFLNFLYMDKERKSSYVGIFMAVFSRIFLMDIALSGIITTADKLNCAIYKCAIDVFSSRFRNEAGNDSEKAPLLRQVDTDIL